MKKISVIISLLVIVFSISCSNASHDFSLIGKWDSTSNKQFAMKFEESGKYTPIFNETSVSNSNDMFYKYFKSSGNNVLVIYTKDNDTRDSLIFKVIDHNKIEFIKNNDKNVIFVKV